MNDSGATFSTSAAAGSRSGSFNGSAYSFVDIPHTYWLVPQRITVEAWIRANSFSNGYWNSTIINRGSNESENGYYGLAVDTSGLPYAMLNIGGTYSNYFNVIGQALSPGTWHHLAMTYDNTTLKLYVNGVAVGSQNH